MTTVWNSLWLWSASDQPQDLPEKGGTDSCLSTKSAWFVCLSGKRLAREIAVNANGAQGVAGKFKQKSPQGQPEQLSVTKQTHL